MSRVMSFATAHNALRERHPEVLPRLYQPFWFDRQREFHAGEPETFSAPVFIRDGERLQARLSLHQIRGGYALQRRAAWTTRRPRRSRRSRIYSPTRRCSTEFRLQAGDIQYVANREIGHSRTEFQDSPKPSAAAC